MRIKEKLKDVKNFLEQNCEIVERKGYGFEADKPISVPTIQDMYDVLKNLKIKNIETSFVCDFDRTSIHVEEYSGLVDHFEVLFCYTQNEKFRFRIYDLYLCAYNKKEENPKKYYLDFFSGLREIVIPQEFELKEKR